MGSSLLFYEDFLKPILVPPDVKEMSIPPGPADVWQNQPTLKGRSRNDPFYSAFKVFGSINTELEVFPLKCVHAYSEA